MLLISVRRLSPNVFISDTLPTLSHTYSFLRPRQSKEVLSCTLAPYPKKYGEYNVFSLSTSSGDFETLPPDLLDLQIKAAVLERRNIATMI